MKTYSLFQIVQLILENYEKTEKSLNFDIKKQERNRQKLFSQTL
jgi:hypothetical protein